MFSQASVAELEKIKVKSVKRRLDVLVYNFLLSHLPVKECEKKLIDESEQLKRRFYSFYRVLFRQVREFMIASTQIAHNVVELILGAEQDEKVLQRVESVLLDRFRRQVSAPPPQGSLIQSLIDSNSKQFYDVYHEEDSGDDISPFEQQFYVLTSPLFVDSLYQGRVLHRTKSFRSRPPTSNAINTLNDVDAAHDDNDEEPADL